MDLRDIQSLYAYNRWANQRMFFVLEKVSQEPFTATIQSSFPSLRETVFHIFAAEWIWLKRWTGASPVASEPVKGVSFETWKTLRSAGAPPPVQLETVAELKGFCDALEQERHAFLGGLTESTLHAPLSFRDMSGTSFSKPLVELLQHVVNHGTYHRGQVTTLLRQTGSETISLDMLYFFREKSQEAAMGR